MDTIGKLADYGERIQSDIRFMGVPKTIDNDLMVTDHTPPATALLPSTSAW